MAAERYTGRSPKSPALHEQACAHVPGGNTRSALYWAPFPLYAKAKPEIWQERAGFTQAYQQFQGAADALRSTAQGGDLAKIRERHRDAAKTCVHCHNSFREKTD